MMGFIGISPSVAQTADPRRINQMFYLRSRAGDTRHFELNSLNTAIAITRFQFGVGLCRARRVTAMAGEPVVVVFIFLRPMRTVCSRRCHGVCISARRRSIERIGSVETMRIWIGDYRRGMAPTQAGEIIVI